MKTEVFVQALNEVEDKYIEEAVNYKRSASHMKVWRVIAIAACACLAASVGFSLIGINMMHREEKAARSASADFKAEEVYEEAAYEAAYEEDMMFDAADEMPLAVMNTFSDSATVQEKPYMAAAEAGGAAEAEETAETQSAKIIYNVDMNVETTEFDASNTQLESLITECGGYCESQYISNNTGSYRNASYIVRVPADKLEDFLAGIPEIGTVTYINRSADDVSENYYDIQSRLTTAEAKLERLQQLLTEAEDMEDIISLESAISDTQWEVDNYQGSLNYYDSKVSYSTVNITLKEVYEVIAEDAPMTFGEKVSAAFHQGVKGFTTFIKNFVIWVSASWIWLIIAAAVIVAVILIIRKVKKTK